jgi:hypothetical protein
MSDGSVIDASITCPTQSTPPTNPNTPSTPPSTSGTPPPSSSNNGGGGSSSGSGGSGSSGSGGSGSGGYHIIQPLQVIDLGRVDQFSKWSTDPNKEFLRFAERWLSDGKADYNHYNNVSMNNYLLRVPNSVNSKTNTKVKIVQRWNGVRPVVRFVYSYFLAYLVDKRKQPHYGGAISNNNWIEYCKTKRSRQIK